MKLYGSENRCDDNETNYYKISSLPSSSSRFPKALSVPNVPKSPAWIINDTR